MPSSPSSNRQDQRVCLTAQQQGVLNVVFSQHCLYRKQHHPYICKAKEHGNMHAKLKFEFFLLRPYGQLSEYLHLPKGVIQQSWTLT